MFLYIGLLQLILLNNINESKKLLLEKFDHFIQKLRFKLFDVYFYLFI